MSLDDRSANRQAHSGAIGFRRKERMEDAVRVFWINSGPGIFHHERSALTADPTHRTHAAAADPAHDTYNRLY